MVDINVTISEPDEISVAVVTEEITVTVESGATSFSALSDTPSGFSGQSGKVATVNSGETALEFTSAGSGDVTGPGVATDENITVFDSTTGKLIKDSGTNISAVTANTAKTGITSQQATDITTNNAKVTNANHSGDATGATALTLATVNSNVGSFTNSNITVNAKGLITAAASGASGITWNEVTGTTQSGSVDNGYITNNVSLVTVTLPDTAVLGSVLRIAGLGAGGWKLAQNASELIYFGNSTTTTGTGGSLASTLSKDSIELVCVVANLEWSVISSVGNITIT